MKVIALALFLSLSFAGVTRAQCAPVPGTGCPGFPQLKDCITNPSIGQLFCTDCQPCPPGCGPIQFNALFLGPPQPFAFPFPTCCSAPPCVIYSPNFFRVDLRQPGVNCIPIPPNPALIGFVFGLQAACVDPVLPCADFSPALRVTIRP